MLATIVLTNSEFAILLVLACIGGVIGIRSGIPRRKNT